MSTVTDKERFDLGIAMMEAYYDKIEVKLAGSLTQYVIVIGWLITSSGARDALVAHWWLVALSILIMTLSAFTYGLNIRHWLRRWRYILTCVKSLNYMEECFYTRYEKFPPFTTLIYLSPIFLMWAVIVALLLAIGFGKF